MEYFNKSTHNLTLLWDFCRIRKWGKDTIPLCSFQNKNIGVGVRMTNPRVAFPIYQEGNQLGKNCLVFRLTIMKQTIIAWNLTINPLQYLVVYVTKIMNGILNLTKHAYNWYWKIKMTKLSLKLCEIDVWRTL